MLKKILAPLFIMSSLFLSAGCSAPDYAANPISGRETLTQISTFDAVLVGVFDGVTTVGDLRK